MSHRLARHPSLIFIALALATIVGALSVGSMVQVFVVGTSRIGLDSPAGVALSAVCAILAAATIVGLMFVVMRGGGYDDDDFRHEDDDEPPPPPKGPFGEPEWWTDFEREFASYVREPDEPRRRDRVLEPVH